MLLESDIFMDALTASATAKKEPKKRKRRLSVSKDSAGSPPQSPTKEASPTVTSPPIIKNIAPPNFYQDTLQTNEDTSEKEADNVNDKEEKKEEEPVASPTPETEEMESSPQEPKKIKSDSDGLKGVLVYVKKKGPKKTLRWKCEDDLVEVRHFELDENERVNVTKNFVDMARNDIICEREALQMVRKLPAEDLMEAQLPWRIPRLVDLPKPPAQPGSKSLEKDIQFAREKSVLQALYFHKRLIPDTPGEPIPENYQIVDPLIIPLDDSETQEIDLRNTPWPEPKTAPPIEAPVNIPPMFRNVPQPPFQNFPPMNSGNFQGMPPRFGAPNHPMAAPQMHEGGPMMDNPQFMNPGGFAPHNMINPAMIAPNLMPPGDMMNQGPIEPMFNEFNANMPQGPGPSDGFGLPMMEPNFTPMQNFPPNFNNYNNNNFNMNRGGGNRGFRRGGNSGGGRWVTLNSGPGQGSNQGPGKWNRGGHQHNRTNRVCKNVKNHGYCRNIETCPFIHPN